MIITDIRMPDMSGIELANLATQRQRDLRIILISGYFVSQQVERRFLRKPFRMRDLEAAVREELNR
jgi:YesN/AraC family two-component response regulator